jgi:3-oxoacyl-[acyl-carrier-protein] synthase III
MNKLYLRGTTKNRNHFIGNQQKIDILQAVCDRLNIFEDHFWHNAENFGMTAPAVTPTVLNHYVGCSLFSAL